MGGGGERRTGHDREGQLTTGALGTTNRRPVSALRSGLGQPRRAARAPQPFFANFVGRPFPAPLALEWTGPELPNCPVLDRVAATCGDGGRWPDGAALPAGAGERSPSSGSRRSSIPPEPGAKARTLGAKARVDREASTLAVVDRTGSSSSPTKDLPLHLPDGGGCKQPRSCLAPRSFAAGSERAIARRCTRGAELLRWFSNTSLLEIRTQRALPWSLPGHGVESAKLLGRIRVESASNTTWSDLR
jgi:hypothetical protein